MQAGPFKIDDSKDTVLTKAMLEGKAEEVTR
jgi:hypothetical protein